MHNSHPGLDEATPERRSWLTRARMPWIIMMVVVLASCSSSSSGCGSCGGCTISFDWLKQYIEFFMKILNPGCQQYCNIKVQLYDAATGQNLSGVQAGSNVDFDLIGGSTTYFSSSANINSDGTFTFPLNPCFDKNTNFDNLKIVPYGGTIKATHGCPAGQCRSWTTSNGDGKFSGFEGCTPIIRIPVSTQRPCRPC